MLVVLYAVLREKGAGVPCRPVGCFSFSCVFGSYCRVRSLYNKPIKHIKPINLKTFFKKPRFFEALVVLNIVISNDLE